MARAFIGLIAVALLSTVAACGGTGSSGSGSSGYGSGSGGGTSTGAATISVHNSSLGNVLVDGKGRTLYLFEADKNGSSACSGSCAQAWPPLTSSGTPQAANGAASNEVGTITRQGGQKQITYHGFPLYYFVGDHKSGDTTGQGLDQFGAKWYVLSPAGNAITTG